MQLREYLFIRRLSVTDFSKILDCNRSYISQIIHGKMRPGKRLAKEIERVTDGLVTVKELLEETSTSEIESSKNEKLQATISSS